nr:hypothetical protein HmN_000336000 [Hymenolepis microstoma]
MKAICCWLFIVILLLTNAINQSSAAWHASFRNLDGEDYQQVKYDERGNDGYEDVQDYGDYRWPSGESNVDDY